jgi:hypothetical protein
MEKTILEDSDRTIHQDYTNVNENNKLALEQSMEELRSYLDLFGPYEASTEHNINNQSISFRPKNLPKKTPREEEYHRQLVALNRRQYVESMKLKQDKEKKFKMKQEAKKQKENELLYTWNHNILPNWYNIKHTKSFNNYFYLGLPNCIRGKIWILCLGNAFSITLDYYNIEVRKAIDIYIQSNENYESNLSLSQDNNNNNNINPYNIITVNKEKSIRVIDLDIERTFPYLGIFKSSSPLSEDLREILRAFVASRPDIGYVQGLSFIGGILLLHMNKFKAYIAMMNLILNPIILPFYTFDEKAIKTRLQLFKQVFYYNLPELCERFENLEVLPEHYFIEWNMTLFTKSVNIDIATRIWDVYMVEGIKAIYSAGIVFLSHFEERFMHMEFEEILKELKTINMINFDDDMVINAMRKVKYPDWVEVEIEKMNEEGIPI